MAGAAEGDGALDSEPEDRDPAAGDVGAAAGVDDPSGTGDGPWWSEQLPRWLFVAFVAAAGPLVLFHFGSYHWFFRDDFVFLADRDGRLPPVFEPHGGPHWVALPRLVYFVLWQGFGLRTYLPYQACVVALHLAAAVLLRVVMRRAGVGPWLASAAAAVLVLFGPGAQNIVWAFQISFTGSLVFGLVHLLLADHDGPANRRDLLGLLAGLAAVMSSGVGITMVAVVAMAVLLRRGWRAALLHAAPPAAVYLAWSQLSDASTDTPFGRPSVGELVAWVRSAQIGTFLGIGHFTVVAVLLAVILVAGTVLAVGPGRGEDLDAARRRLAAPVALLAGGFLFAATTGLGRFFAGEQAARGSRYLYLGAAFTLPLLAVAAQELARRWRVLTPVLVGLFVVAIPFNLEGFTPEVFAKPYMDERRRILTTAVRLPFARAVPRDVQPVPDAYASDAVTIGFLLNAAHTGDLTPSTTGITPQVVAEFRVRLGVAARPADTETAAIDRCRTVAGEEIWSPERKERVIVSGPVAIAARDDRGRFGPAVTLGTDGTQNELTVELPDLELRLRPVGAPSVLVCEQR